MRRWLIALAAAASAILVTTPAQAAAWHNIAGSCGSNPYNWYYSTNVREKSGNGWITAKFHNLPDVYLNFGVAGVGSEVFGWDTFEVENNEQSLAWSYDTVLFQNAFAPWETCGSWCSKSFAGEEYY